MTLDDFKEDDDPVEKFKRYDHDRLDKQLEDIAAGVRERLPYDFRLDFIEASPQMEKPKCWLYQREHNDEIVFFIRVSEKLWNHDEEKLVTQVTLAMFKLYVWQKQLKILDDEDKKIDDKENDKVVSWISGYYGIDIGDILIDDELWEETVVKVRESQ